MSVVVAYTPLSFINNGDQHSAVYARVLREPAAGQDA